MKHFALLVFWVLCPFLLSAQFTIGSGNSIEFDGSTSNVTVTNSTTSTLDYPISIACWVKLHSATPNIAQPVFFSSLTTTFYQGFWFTINPSGQLALSFGDGQGTNNQAYRRTGLCNFPLVANQWVHIAGVATSATNMQHYINGVPQAMSYSGSGLTTLSNPLSNAFIGRNSRTGTVMDGEVDELSVWSKALSQSEIRDLMCEKLSGNEANLEAYYRFDEAVGSNTISDLSPNGDNASNASTAVFDTSFAPVGDRSVWEYNSQNPVSLSGQAFNQVFVSPSSGGNATGYHLFIVDSIPRPLPPGPQTPNLNHHFGVFSVDNNDNMDVSVSFSPPYTGTNQYGVDWKNHAPANAWVNNPARNAPALNLLNESPGRVYCLMDDPPCQPLDLFPSDSLVCDSLVLMAPSSWTNRVWNTGSTSNTVLATTSGTYWVSGIDTNGCNQSDTIQVTVLNSGNVDLLPSDTLICEANRFDISLNYPNAQAFTWSNGASTNSTTVFTNTTLWVEVFFAGNCSVRDTMQVRFSDDREPVSERTFALCPGENLQVDIDPLQFAGALWSDGTNGLSINISTPGVYTVSAIKPDGCEELDTIRVELPIGSDDFGLFGDTLFCAGTSFTLRAPDSVAVRWPNGSDSTFVVSRTMDIRVELDNGCKDTVNYFEARMVSCECDVQFPSAFTPYNQDGLNDDFGPGTDCNFLEYQLWIFDRWGTQYYYSNELGARFDGRDEQGNLLPAGTYLYRFRYRTDRTSGMRRGSIQVLP